jgi:hypothetical protein
MDTLITALAAIAAYIFGVKAGRAIARRFRANRYIKWKREWEERKDKWS